MRIGLVSALPVLFLSAQTQPPADQKSALEGQVVNSATGEPLRKAHLTLRRVDASGGEIGSSPAGASVVSAVTDAQGKFAFAGLEAGRYELIGRHDGFVEQRYGARRRYRPGTPISLMAGEQKRDIVMRLAPFGSVSGRMVDEDGDPIPYVQVILLAFQYTSKGRQLIPNQSGSTNDLGEYRIFGVNPDRYYLKASPPNTVRTAPDDLDGESYVTAYYPGVPDALSAAPLDVGPGQQLRGIDMALRQRRPVSIRGRAIKPAGAASMTLVLSTSDAAGTSTSMGVGIRDPDGKFQLQGVAPGAYSLIARTGVDNKPYSARVPIQVGSTDIEGIELHLAPAVDLTGQVRIEGKTEAKPARVFLDLEGQDSSAGADVKEDGRFGFYELGPDVYKISVRPPEGLYLKSVRWGDADITDSGLDLSAGAAAGELVITLSANGGEIDGSVESDQSEPAASTTVTLVPAVSQAHFKMTTTDAQGHFRIRGIAPGSYKLFAWDDVNVSAVEYDPEFLKAFELMGQSVEISENAKEDVHLKLIRTPAEQ